MYREGVVHGYHAAATGSLPDVGLRSRLSWMVSGPARIDELERSVRSLQHQLDEMQQQQDSTLDGVRTSVASVLDDVTARLAAIDATDG